MNNNEKMGVAGASLGSSFAIFVGLINLFAMLYAAVEFEGFAVWVYAFLAVLAGVGVVASAVARVLTELVLKLDGKEF